MKIKVSDYIASRLTEAGITKGFTVVGGGAMHLNDAFGHHPGLKMTYNHHEQACAIAAEGYARVTGRPALVCVTTGPGGTNAITGVVGAWTDSIPMIVISGQVRYDWTVRSAGMDLRALGDQEFDICRAVSCMTKYCEMVTRAADIRYCLEKAIYLANHGRPGPVWLDIPHNVLGSYIDPDTLRGYNPAECEEKVPEITHFMAEEILERVKLAERPVMIAGSAVTQRGVRKQFLKVAEKLGIPVLTGSWTAHDAYPSDGELFAGHPGNFGDRAGNFAMQNADLILSVGSRLGIRVTGFNSGAWARDAYTIVNDVDVNELMKPTVHVDMPLWGDCGQFLDILDTVIDEKNDLPIWKGGRGIKEMNWIDTCRYWVKKYPAVTEAELGQTGPEANVYAFMKMLSDKIPEGRIIVAGNGSASTVGCQAFDIKNGQRFVVNSSIASMGYDLPASIGAAAAAGETEEYCGEITLVTGDGSLQMNLQELETIIYNKLPVRIFVINNGGYHSIRQTQRNYFPDKPLVGIGPESGDLGFPELEKLAAAYGYPYYLLRTNDEIREKLDEVLSAPAPLICEVTVDTKQSYEPKNSAKQLADGTMVSPPLEDMKPFLSDEEMAENMIVPRMEY